MVLAIRKQKLIPQFLHPQTILPKWNHCLGYYRVAQKMGLRVEFDCARCDCAIKRLFYTDAAACPRNIASDLVTVFTKKKLIRVDKTCDRTKDVRLCVVYLKLGSRHRTFVGSARIEARRNLRSIAWFMTWGERLLLLYRRSWPRNGRNFRWTPCVLQSLLGRKESVRVSVSKEVVSRDDCFFCIVPVCCKKYKKCALNCR